MVKKTKLEKKMGLNKEMVKVMKELIEQEINRELYEAYIEEAFTNADREPYAS